VSQFRPCLAAARPSRAACKALRSNDPRQHERQPLARAPKSFPACERQQEHCHKSVRQARNLRGNRVVCVGRWIPNRQLTVAWGEPCLEAPLRCSSSYQKKGARRKMEEEEECTRRENERRERRRTNVRKDIATTSVRQAAHSQRDGVCQQASTRAVAARVAGLAEVAQTRASRRPRSVAELASIAAVLHYNLAHACSRRFGMELRTLSGKESAICARCSRVAPGDRRVTELPTACLQFLKKSRRGGRLEKMRACMRHVATTSVIT